MAPTQQVFANPAPAANTVFKDNIFDGKVLFCTGGGSGICKKMTEAIMKLGANAVITSRKLDRLSQSAKELSEISGRTCLPAQADVRDPAQLKQAVQVAIDNFGKIDFVICGAAGNFLAPIEGLSENGFKTVIDIDTLGTYNTVKATLPYVRQSHGAYIHVSATLHYRGSPYQPHVSAAKAAVDALSQVIAVEEGPKGIRSNVIAPGPIADTEGMSRLTTTAEEAKANNYIPLGRPGQTGDIANTAVFLFSEAANWITGQVFVVDGGNEQLRTVPLPYPACVLDPESVKSLFPSKI